jgi:hypothetical protein
MRSYRGVLCSWTLGLRVDLLYQQGHCYIRGETKCFKFHIARCGSDENWLPREMSPQAGY